MVDTRRRNAIRFAWTLVLGFFLGGVLTKLAEVVLPEGATTREFLLISVRASVGPLDVDLVGVAFVLGPVTLTLNFLTLVGIAIVALIVRSWI